MSAAQPNLVAAWVGVLLGFASGAVIGLFFDRDDWLGGFSSWRRRLTRLGHISFFGLAFVNIAFVVSAPHLHVDDDALRVPSRLLLVGTVAMPAACFLSAWRERLRGAFVLPVGALLTAGVWIVCLVLAGPR